MLCTDLDALRLPIKARQGHPGRPAIDPAILFALWLWATILGICPLPFAGAPMTTS